MSRFSGKLKQLIEESGKKVYQLAKMAALDRTTIQRAMTGERLPGLDFVEKLCDYLRVSPSDKAELLELYSISKIGEKVYENRRYIKELVERIAAINISKGKSYNLQKYVAFNRKTNNDTEVFTGQYIVNNIIKDVLEVEVANNSSPEISISVPFSYSFLFDLLYQLYISENGKIIIKNIIRFIKNPLAYQYTNYNLGILSNVMPFAFAAGNGYKPYYYYDNFNETNDIALLMPYYIITRKYLITISTDFKTAILNSNEMIVNTYREKFNTAIGLSNPLITQLSSCEALLFAFLKSYKNFGPVSHVIEPQPCFAWYYTNDLISTHLRQEVDNRENVLNLLYNYYDNYRNCKNRLISIFSIEGLSHFIATGILSDLPTQFAIPFSMKERIMLLTKLRNDIYNNIYKVYVANPLKFIIPSSTIQLYNTDGVEFFSNNNGVISSSLIGEKSISEAFYDFCETLPDSGLLYSKEETIKIIDDFIEQCNRIITLEPIGDAS